MQSCKYFNDTKVSTDLKKGSKFLVIQFIVHQFFKCMPLIWRPLLLYFTCIMHEHLHVDYKNLLSTREIWNFNGFKAYTSHLIVGVDWTPENALFRMKKDRLIMWWEVRKLNICKHHKYPDCNTNHKHHADYMVCSHNNNVFIMIIFITVGVPIS